MNIDNFNPWWRIKQVPAQLIGKKRPLFNKVVTYLKNRQILLFTGIRRVGKTTFMFQLINELISNMNVNPYHIFYFSFDEKIDDINELIKVYEEQVLKDSISNKKIFLFFDEIHKLKDWSDRIKIIYDMNPNVKICLSGSAQIILLKNTRESLAGRFFNIKVEPLDFDEYLQFKKVNIDPQREKTFEMEIKKQLNGFLSTGGFVEALSMQGEELIKYFKESLIERVIFKDIPESFNTSIRGLLYTLLKIIAEHPGMYLDYKNLSSDLKYDHRTIAEYLSYLDYTLFIQRLYNYSSKLIISEKKLRRAYLSNTAFTLALNPQIENPVLMEQLFVNMLKAGFFYRSPQKEEIDIVHVKNKIVIPVEIKISNKINERDAKAMFRFMSVFDLNKGIFISREQENTFKQDSRVINIIPYWKYWTINKFLNNY